MNCLNSKGDVTRGGLTMLSTEQPRAIVFVSAPWLSNAGFAAGAFGLQAAVGELGR